MYNWKYQKKLKNQKIFENFEKLKKLEKLNKKKILISMRLQKMGSSVQLVYVGSVFPLKRFLTKYYPFLYINPNQVYFLSYNFDNMHFKRVATCIF